jgi:hypothetical protein
MEQLERNGQNGTAITDKQKRSDIIGLPAQDSQDGTVRTGKLEQDSRYRKLGQDSRDNSQDNNRERTDRTVQPGKERQNRTA